VLTLGIGEDERLARIIHKKAMNNPGSNGEAYSSAGIMQGEAHRMGAARSPGWVRGKDGPGILDRPWATSYQGFW
jgi:hypothetical protein